jgi:hypothetical protein
MVASPVSKPMWVWRHRNWLLLLGALLAGWGVCRWLTEPLEDRAPTQGPSPPATADAGGPRRTREFPAWPAGRLDGQAAKRLLLETLLEVRERLAKVEGYTATFRKQERINGTLGPEQSMAMKLRHHPFAVYFKYLSPIEGKEVVYAEGCHENKIIAHSGGLARLLVPRMALAPDNPIAMAETRHPITEAGLASLTEKLVGFRRLDLDDPQAVTVLDRAPDAKGRAMLRSLHEHPNFDSQSPFARVEVLYDPESRLPLEITSYDWPRPGQQGELLLAEHYVYENLDLDAVLTIHDFDPANPDYSFHRY